MQTTFRLNKRELNRLISESVRRIIVNEAFGEDFEDTLSWVKRKKTDMSPNEQVRFAKNIIAKKQRSNLHNVSKEKPSSFKNMKEICNYYGMPKSAWQPFPETREEIEDMGGVIDYSMPFPIECMDKDNWNEFTDEVIKYLEKGTVKIGGYRIVDHSFEYSYNNKYVFITAITDVNY